MKGESSTKGNGGSFLNAIPAAGYVFFAVFVLRLIVLARLTESPFLLPARGDMHFYNEWAQRILQGQFTDYRAFYGLPLYAYLLAVVYKLFGYSPFVPGLLQACLDAGTATLLYVSAMRIFGANSSLATAAALLNFARQHRGSIIGAAAAAGWALFVPAQAYSAILMPTAWLVFTVWFLVWRVIRLDQIPGRWACFGYGLLIGVTAMGIATIFFIMPLLLAAIFLSRPASRARLIARGAAISMLFLGTALGTSPCWLHNYFVARDPVFLSAHSGINFWIGNNPTANGYPRIPPGLSAGQAAMLQDSITVAERAAGVPLKRSQVSAYWSAKADTFIKENPREWLGLMMVKLRNFWNAFQYDDLSIVTNMREQGVILPGLSFGLVAAFALPGMVLAVLKVPGSRWIAAAVMLHMASLLTVFVTERYRLAAVPGLLLFAAFALFKLWEFCAVLQPAKLGALLAAIVSAALIVSLPQRDPALWALDAYNSGWQALDSNDLPLARKKLELAYAYVPDNAEINLALGNLNYANKDLSRAAAAYRAALAIEPQHKSALTNLGVVALEMQQPDQAADLFRAAIAAAPTVAKTHYLLARAELQLGHVAVAESEIETALRLNPAQPEFQQLREEIARVAAPHRP